MDPSAGWAWRIALLAAAMFLFAGAVVAQEDDPVLDEKPLSQWVKQLRSDNRGLQLKAAKTLVAAPTNLHARITPLVIPVLKSERENDKFVGAQILGEYGAASRVAVPELLEMLGGTQYERNRAAAAKALGQILKDAKPDDEIEKVTQALIKVFEDKYSDVRREALTACGMIGPAAKSVIPYLEKRLRDRAFATGRKPWEELGERAEVERAAAWTAGRMGPLAACHIDLLISKMQAEGERMPETVEAIGLIGPVHENVIPNIIDKIEICTSDGNMWVFRMKGLEALSRFGEKSLPALLLVKRMLNNGREALGARIAMMKYLGALGPAAKDYAPQILGQIQYAETRNEAEAKTLKEEAVKAYKAVTGQEPPAAAKK